MRELGSLDGERSRSFLGGCAPPSAAIPAHTAALRVIKRLLKPNLCSVIILRKRIFIKIIGICRLPLGDICGKCSCEDPSLSCRPPCSRKTKWGVQLHSQSLPATVCPNSLQGPEAYGKPCLRVTKPALLSSAPVGYLWPERRATGLSSPSPFPRSRSRFSRAQRRSPTRPLIAGVRGASGIPGQRAGRVSRAGMPLLGRPRNGTAVAVAVATAGEGAAYYQ
ncbi:uncharacterized protein LOC126648739 [Myiozetetes cayanensis]|uniref:uncharacterized protein LOC126648739 n=1 Tax=Myiozetetes cayanensis TaxID=478635 RepID=UPI00215EF367|nr:uncharacterized protein LOC126648739 [Myiozetetes cayanensis]